MEARRSGRLSLGTAMGLVGGVALACARLIPAARSGRMGEAVVDVMLMMALLGAPILGVALVRRADRRRAD